MCIVSEMRFLLREWQNVMKQFWNFDTYHLPILDDFSLIQGMI